MPHTCVKCGRKHDDDGIILTGCSCGSRMFLFVRNGNGKSREGLYRFDLHALLRPSEVLASAALTVREEGMYEIDLSRAFKPVADSNEPSASE